MSDDVEEAIKKASELAELTGRDKKDVIADLLDDGILNMSAGQDSEPKKDILDKAQEKVDKLKTLFMTLLPILTILIGGTGFEMLGVTDWSPVGDEPEEYYDVYGCTDYAAPNYYPEATIDDGSCEPTEEPIWGCTDDTADNYDPEAEEDDGSCEYLPPPECEPVFYDIYVYYQSNNTKVMVEFDLDCTNEGVTETVQVQFLAWTNDTNPSNSEGPYNWTSEHYDITGEEWDSHQLTLGNFSHDYYDLYIYVIGEDDEIAIEKQWLNIEIKEGT